MVKESCKTKVRKKLLRLSINPEVSKYISDAVDYCIENEIQPLDVILSRHIYPMLEYRYNKCPKSIEREISKEINSAWKEVKHEKFLNELDYSNRPTVKKIIVLLLLQFDY